MSAHPSTTETEVKLRVPEPEKARSLLQHLGFVPSTPRLFEINILYDSAQGLLRDQAKALRLRQVGGRVILTFKGKPQPGKHKVREELECEVSDFGICDTILDRIGFSGTFRYEKFRTEFHSVDETGLITLDETPIGTFFELEGQPEWIDHTAARLGFSDSNYITESYARLYSEFCTTKNIMPTNMVFPA